MFVSQALWIAWSCWMVALVPDAPGWHAPWRAPVPIADGQVLVQAPAQSAPRAKTLEQVRKTPRPVTVPFELLPTMHFAVQIRVNGKGPFRVVFDTGAPLVVLGNRIAKEAELFSAEALKRPAFFGMRGQTTVKTLELGDARVEDVPVVVMDHPLLKALAQAVGPIDGIVGFPFFARFRTTVDYRAKQLQFVSVDYRPPDVMTELMGRMVAPRSEQEVRVLVPGALWGCRVEKAKDDDSAGVTIVHVYPDTPAARAGLQAQDRLLTLDGRWTDSIEDCFRALEKIAPGETVEVSIKRGDRILKLSITPGPGS
ncbi:MAG: serine protease [Gemmataceae bacterium]